MTVVESLRRSNSFGNPGEDNDSKREGIPMVPNTLTVR